MSRISELVDVYWNWHRRCWSLRGVATRLVAGHAERLVLKGCTMRVSNAGRLRVLRERRRNVHAAIRGTLTTRRPSGQLVAITYSPFLHTTFVRRIDATPVYAAAVVIFEPDRVVWATSVE